MEYKGIKGRELGENIAWAGFHMSPEEVENARMGLAQHQPDLLGHLPGRGSSQLVDRFATIGMARAVVQGNLLLLGDLAVSPTLREGVVFETVSSSVETGLAALGQAAEDLSALSQD